MSERDTKTIQHFGYENTLEKTYSTSHNKNAVDYFVEVLKLEKCDLNKKIKVIFDYDPDFEHCLIQIQN